MNTFLSNISFPIIELNLAGSWGTPFNLSVTGNPVMGFVTDDM